LADPDSYEKNAVRQDHEAATYTQKIDKSMARINWQEDAIVIERTVRTLEPSPGAYTFLDKKRLKIHGAHAVQTSTDNAPGTVISVSKSDFTVQTGAGALKVTSVQPESRKTMTSAQFLQSHDLQVGAVLGIE
jgi:methionyl-tRNA formyltransferase